MNNLDRFFSKDIGSFSDSYFKYLKQILDNIDLLEVKRFVEILLDAREKGKTVFFIGNGGSASTASHFANDLSFGCNEYEKPFHVVSLTDNVSILTALGNDFGYEEIFVRQLMIQSKPGDVLVGISASGNSPNIINAFKYASDVGILSVALTAFDGGKMKENADEGIHVPTDFKEYGPAEDAHMILDHLVTAYLMRVIRLA
ncbi:phosphoheptose isomerase [Desulfocapsa sulfexigens DSM 10523]|uniref:Phosphoheptose isomerase n=1 Tax=Desulfocapsa sulfexigens (strain DSM 10523 / SB164P1) TaxID=1167006 RepID=M1PRM0_DESSD|nr:SIS domain-containing protein [Desulfocapsa sulfexigens]AGF78981.1 phosphoheptose isomerase [Desulfocapsa sulfexigens DSM 10523]